MKSSDAVLLAKKILVGIVIGLVPLVILTSGLWLTKKSFTKNSRNAANQNVEVSRAH